MQNQFYPPDLTDNQWEHIKDLFPIHVGKRGRPRELDLRVVVNAVFYVLMTGCQWRYLPADYPCWQSVYYYLSLVAAQRQMATNSRPSACVSAPLSQLT